MRGCAGEVGTTVSACGQDGHVRTKAMEFAFHHVESDDAAADTVLHHQIDCEVLDEERRRVPDRLLVEGVQHGMTSSISGRAGALCNTLTEVSGHTAEGSLIDAS